MSMGETQLVLILKLDDTNDSGLSPRDLDSSDLASFPGHNTRPPKKEGSTGFNPFHAKYFNDDMLLEVPAIDAELDITGGKDSDMEPEDESPNMAST